MMNLKSSFNTILLYINIFCCAILFGLGLSISGMVNPEKIQNFLDVFGEWDPDLLVVFVSALVVTMAGYRLISYKKHPVLANHYCLPEKTRIDRTLVIGSIFFGVGWGMAGYCPGPAFSALAYCHKDALYFILGMLSGTLVYHFAKWIFKKRKLQ